MGILEESNQAVSAAALDGPAPIVLVCDLGLPGSAYREMLMVANAGSSHYELDLLADSESPEMSISQWADALDELLDRIPTVSATCIGDGVGSLVLEHFAATRPDRVARLVLVSPLHGLSPEARRECSDVADRVDDEGIEAFIKWRHAQSKSDPERSISDLAISLDGRDPERLARACRAVADAHTSDLSSVVAPTLVCADRSSDGQVRGAAMVCDAVSGSEAVELAGRGTNLSVTNPTELGESLRDFFSSTTEQREEVAP